jgi:CubicO group peptidase (beta-lactamase class C family)
MKKLLVLACCWCGSLFAQSGDAGILLKRLEGFDTVVTGVMRDWKLAGLSIGVVYKNQVLYAKGFGYRDIEKQLRVTPHTVFHIASCTKAFTAMLVGLAAEDKLIDINKPVHDYFPQLEFYTPLLTSLITAKDMMTHRTGLPRHDWATHAKTPLPMDTVIRRIRYLEPGKGIREEIQYTNLMYVALGELTHKLTGRTWSQQLQERIFDPLEMKESSTGFADLPLHTEYSKGYFVRGDSLVAGGISKEGANAAGSINSSVIDIGQWLICWINGGRYKNKQVLPALFARQASAPQMSAPSRPQPSLPAYPDVFFGDMGYGWVIDSYRGHYHVQHSGDLPLYSSNVAFFPTDSIGIVVLVNKFDATVPELISSLLADRLLALPYKNWSGLLLDLQAKRSAGNASKPVTASPVPQSHRPQEYTGLYRHPGYGTILVTLEQGKLVAAHNEQPFSFVPDGADNFKANVPGGKLRAILKEGKVVALAGSFEAGIAEIIFNRVP